MDRITQALLGEFVEQNSLQSLAEDSAFEHFSGFLVTSSHYSESFETEEISTGSGGDTGVDCLAIIVNGMLVNEPEEIEDLASQNGFLDVTFVFTQAERSAAFETAKIGQFAFGVLDFFKESPQLPRNERMQMSGRIWSAILERSRLFKKGNPQCFLYYVTTGKWNDDQNLVVRRDAAKKDVQDIGLFRKVDFECIDSVRLQKLYREAQNQISVEVTFSERTVIPDILGVEQAYLGLLPATQFLKLIQKRKGEIITSIFYDNVRHWQDWNPVNTEIRETLSNASNQILFPLFNNGITIVAKKISPTANKFLLEDYQIVNGCQTSFVIYDCRDAIDDRVMIPVRLIATTDENIKNSIIKATNRQTEVTEEQLFALSDFPKKLESYFPTFDGRKKLYYERRSRQYNGVPGIEKVRVISMTVLLRAFASIFLDLPHRTTRNYKALLKQIGTSIFNKEHRLEPYYVSAYAHHRLEYLFRNQTISPDLKAARYHLLLAFRKLCVPGIPPRMNSREMERYCSTILDILWNDDACKMKFVEAANHVLGSAGGNLHRDNIRTEVYTNSLVARLNAASQTP